MDLAAPRPSDLPSASSDHFLVRADVLVDWSLLETEGDDIAAPIPVFAIRIALLKHWYGLSDGDLSFHVLDRASFRTFVGFAGDGGASDAQILQELGEGAWRRHPGMADAVAAVEDQLQGIGYTVRGGGLSEPSLSPCTESGGEIEKTESTALFRPGELGGMVEALTAKASAQGLMAPPSTPQEVRAEPSMDAPMPKIEPEPVAEERSGKSVRAVLEWPWGQRSELSEHLNIGRDYQFSPLAREMTPYTHVSRKHAELLVYGDGVWVRDLGSRNGTFVNDEEVPKGQAYLIDSDSVIRFGPLLAVSLKLSP